MSDYITRHGEVISSKKRSLIAERYHVITKAINTEFWNSISNNNHSLYVGSYGRGTAVDTSDIDILAELPDYIFDRYNISYGNGQSRLLQAVREAILKPYPRSVVHADGQVVKIIFSDDMKFEIVPAFQYSSWGAGYKYPDTNMGGKWCSTNPKAEQKAMQDKNRASNGLLYDTCKHMRYIRDNNYSSYHLSGIVIDSFVYDAIDNWKWPEENESSASQPGDYENTLYNYFRENVLMGPHILFAPGSRQQVNGNSSIDCLKKVLEYLVK